MKILGGKTERGAIGLPTRAKSVPGPFAATVGRLAAWAKVPSMPPFIADSAPQAAGYFYRMAGSRVVFVLRVAKKQRNGHPAHAAQPASPVARAACFDLYSSLITAEFCCEARNLAAHGQQGTGFAEGTAS
jgi:hypothetical protein